LTTENGDFHYDEINSIIKGGNYGFPTLQPPNLPPERTNNTSIKPLRTYWETIAPTQMIYYDGDALPELKGMFLFGSFTGDIYGLRMSEDKKSIVEELKIELEHFPFVPTVGIAQSPDGKIYYGGYQIYTLDTLGEKEQMLFTIEVNSPSIVNIAEINVDEEQKRIVIDANLSGTVAPDSTLTLRIPRALLDNITAVAVDDRQRGPGPIEFSINEFGPDYTSLSVNIGAGTVNTEGIKLTIY
jgi:hypothetical protein